MPEAQVHPIWWIAPQLELSPQANEVRKHDKDEFTTFASVVFTKESFLCNTDSMMVLIHWNTVPAYIRVARTYHSMSTHHTTWICFLRKVAFVHFMTNFFILSNSSSWPASKSGESWNTNFWLLLNTISWLISWIHAAESELDWNGTIKVFMVAITLTSVDPSIVKLTWLHVDGIST